MNKSEYIRPDWPAPPSVRAISTTRTGGVSAAPYESFNLSSRVGDDPRAVTVNRRRLKQELELPGEPLWLKQVHGNRLVAFDEQAASDRQSDPAADASWSKQAGQVCTLLTADCLPLLLCDRNGDWVAALHCGWRGLAGGIIESVLAQLPGRREQIIAWMGPAIGPDAFEIGADVRNALLDSERASVDAFRPGESDDRCHADMYSVARFQLEKLGVGQTFGGGFCTVSDEQRFFSFRRDETTGRMATLVWLTG